MSMLSILHKLRQYHELAIKGGTYSNGHYACFITPHYEILSIGQIYTTMTDLYAPSIHAEIDAMKKIIHWKERPRKIILISVRIGADNNFKMARPCIDCQRILFRRLKILRIYFTTNSDDDTKIYDERRSVGWTGWYKSRGITV